MRLDLELPEGAETILLDSSQSALNVAEILRRKGHPLNTRCGERDLCGGCVVELLAGEVLPAAGGEFRACQHRLAGDSSIRIPQRSLLAYEPQVVGDYRINVPFAHDPVSSGIGAAVDIGTTTVVVEMIDLQAGKVLSRASGFNQQMRFGDDVLTRINLCLLDDSMVDTLRNAVVEATIQPLLQEALALAGVDSVDAISVSGNSTMLHLFAGENPSTMGFAPFTPVFLEPRDMDAASVGLSPGSARVRLLPGAAAYVGADIVAGVFASGMAYDEGPALFVDIGTNGEIVFKSGERLLGCATAAGPAFEGSLLRCGLRAGVGAISHIDICPDLDVRMEVIGGGKPTGVCGSAFVDFLAEGVRAGLLNHAGRFDPAAVERHPEKFAKAEAGLGMILARGQGKRPIQVDEADIGRLLQAKAAIAAGILILMKQVGVTPSEVKTLYLAGGFGMHLRLDSAIDCSLLPGFHKDQVQLVGNTSLGGAHLSLMDKSVVDELDRIRRDIDIVELNLDPDFEDTYIDQLSLPQ